MSEKDTKNGISKRAFMIALVLLLLTHILMGVTLVILSKNKLRNQIEERMLDIAKTAAFQLDGDELKNLTAADVNTEPYQKALTTLRSFQVNIQLDYIYGLKDNGDGTFSFTIDPDPDSPGEFGEKVETTEALKNAANGTADIDKEAHTDEWGRFYSAYCPVFDSDGNVAGIVGVDFNANWFDDAISLHIAAVIIITMVAMTIAIVFTLIMRTTKIEGRYKEQLEETLQREHEQEQELGSARHLAYTDPLTGVKNKHAYLEAVERINKGVEEGSITEFGVIVFDINGLKKINDTLGHEEGDNYIKEGCAHICGKFCHSPVFRIGGDEFVVLLEGSDYARRDTLLGEFDREVEENRGTRSAVVSTGLDIYDPAKDDGFKPVFERADKKMYERKIYLKKRK